MNFMDMLPKLKGQISIPYSNKQSLADVASQPDVIKINSTNDPLNGEVKKNQIEHELLISEKVDCVFNFSTHQRHISRKI